MPPAIIKGYGYTKTYKAKQEKRNLHRHVVFYNYRVSGVYYFPDFTECPEKNTYE